MSSAASRATRTPRTRWPQSCRKRESSHAPGSPRSRTSTWPGRAGGTVFVAEIKSITDDNEEEQLRLGLGQVLRYRHHLGKLGHQRVVALLVPERTPRDESWNDLCRDLGVILLSEATLRRAPHLHAPAEPAAGTPR